MILRILYHLGLTNLSREQYLNLTKNEPYKIITKLTNILLFTMMVIVFFIVLFIFTGQSHAYTLTDSEASTYMHQHKVPEYLHHYVSDISIDIRHNDYISRGLRYRKLAEVNRYGQITVFTENLTTFQLCHEIGHIMHWWKGHDEYDNTETMANFFAYEAMHTDNIHDLLDRWNMWRRIFDRVERGYE